MEFSYSVESVGEARFNTCSCVTAIAGLTGVFDFYTLSFYDNISLYLLYRPNKNLSHRMLGSGGLAGNVIRLVKDKQIIEQSLDAKSFSVRMLDNESANNFNQHTEAINLCNVYTEICSAIISELHHNVSNNILIEYKNMIKTSYFLKNTKKTYEDMLKSINWKFMFDGSSLSEEDIDIFEDEINKYEFDFNKLYFNVKDLHIDISRFSNYIDPFVLIERYRSQQEQLQKKRKANEKAISLMQMVCGMNLTEHYLRKNYIVVNRDGWEFKIDYRGISITPPMIEPEYTATSFWMCVHNKHRACHQIDTVVILYLYVKNKLRKLFEIGNYYISHQQTKVQLEELLERIENK